MTFRLWPFNESRSTRQEEQQVKDRRWQGGGGVISCRLDRGGELIQAWQGVIQHRLGRGVVQYRLGVGVLRYRTGKGVIKLRLGRGVIRYKPLQGSDQI